MNAYTTRGQARMQPHDVATLLRASTGSYVAATALAAFERQRGWQAQAERDGLLAQVDVTTPTAASPIVRLRQAIEAALVCAGERRAGSPRGGAAPETVSVASTLGPTG